MSRPSASARCSRSSAPLRLHLCTFVHTVRDVSFLMMTFAVASGVSGTLFTRASKGFSRQRYGLAAIVCYAVATGLMAWLVKRLPVGIVYAVWTGSAAVVLLAVDAFAFKVRTTRLQLVGMALTLVGVMLLGMGAH